ncbi:MAG: hypothetical protein J5606_09740 [Bacteroidales bacterium]|nr:hypothetical protein [Bacteroidales bacterium]
MKKHIIFIVCLLALTTTFHSCKNKDFSDEEYIAFAKNIEKSILEGNADIMNQAFDYKNFNKLVLSDFKLNKQEQEEAETILKNEILPGNLKAEAVKNGGDFMFLKFYRKDKQAFALFRLYYQGGISIEEYELKVVDGAIKIEDVFIVNSGVKWSENYRFEMAVKFNILNEEIANTNKLLIAKSYIENDELDKADSLLLYLLPQEQNNLYARVLDLKLASLLYNYDEFEEYADKFKQNFTTEERIADFFLIHSSMTNGLVEETQNNINNLVRQCGFDPIYYLYMSQVFFNVDAYDFALQTLDSAIVYLPGLFDLYVEKMNIYYALEDYQKLTETILEVDNLFLPMPEDVENYSKHFAKAVKSPYFQEWIEKRKSMQYNNTNNQ